MKFFKSRLLLLLKIFGVIFFILISIYLIRKANRYYLISLFGVNCVDYKQNVFSRKLNDKIIKYSALAKLTGIKVCNDENDLKKRIEEVKLIKIRNGEGYIIDRMSTSYPCVTKESKILLEEIGRRFREKTSQNGLKNSRFIVTSMTRTTKMMKGLRKNNPNASANSPHLYGNAFDISYIRFSVQKWFLTYCDKKFLKEALAEVIWQLRNEKKCWATFETGQSCFHVVAR